MDAGKVYDFNRLPPLGEEGPWLRSLRMSLVPGGMSQAELAEFILRSAAHRYLGAASRVVHGGQPPADLEPLETMALCRDVLGELVKSDTALRAVANAPTGLAAADDPGGWFQVAQPVKMRLRSRIAAIEAGRHRPRGGLMHFLATLWQARHDADALRPISPESEPTWALTQAGPSMAGELISVLDMGLVPRQLADLPLSAAPRIGIQFLWEERPAWAGLNMIQVTNTYHFGQNAMLLGIGELVVFADFGLQLQGHLALVVDPDGRLCLGRMSTQMSEPDVFIELPNIDGIEQRWQRSKLQFLGMAVHRAFTQNGLLSSSPFSFWHEQTDLG